MKDNFVIEDNEAIIKINKNIYDKKILVQATYVKLEDFYFLIDEDDINYIISMRYKEDKKITSKEIYEFFDELIESSSYIDQLKRTNEIRSKILEAALLPQQNNTVDLKKQNEH